MPNSEREFDSLQSELTAIMPNISVEGASSTSLYGGSQLILDSEKFKSPQLIQLLFKLIGARQFGPGEKLMWGFDFNYLGHECTITFEKFGLRFYSPKSHTAKNLNGRFIGELSNGLRALRRVTGHLSTDLYMSSSQFGFINNAGYLYGGYEFHKSAAENIYGEQVEPKELTLQEMIRQPAKYRAGFWNSIAATNAYFSYLEHLSIGLLIFHNSEKSGLAIREFLSKSWKEKYEFLFGGSNSSIQGPLSELNEIYQKQRNPFAHGLISKGMESAHVFIEGLGFMPMNPLKTPIELHYFSATEHQPTFEKNTRVFNSFLQTLRGGDFSNAFKWIDAGLNFRFDSQFKNLLDDALKNDDFDNFVLHQSHLYEQAINMDF